MVQKIIEAKGPFQFYNRVHLTELTGLAATNLKEFMTILKDVPDDVIFFHTHHFLEIPAYLNPEPANDFALWVRDSLGEEALGEKLASVNTASEFLNMGAARNRFISIIEQHLVESGGSREAFSGKEFYFVKSVSFIWPSYSAHDLKEFTEALRKITASCLFYHVFESRLRLGQGFNDFSLWMRDSLGEIELSQEVARFDPYTYSLEGLRLALILLVEHHIKPIS